MQFYNFIIDQKTISKDTLIDYLKLIAPFAPFIAEEIYQSIIHLLNLALFILNPGQNLIPV